MAATGGHGGRFIERAGPMRLRSAVLPVAVICAAAVAVPSPALAGTEQCTLVMPTKVVINAKIVESALRLGNNCTANSADRASWDLVHSTGKIADLDFLPEDFAAGVTYGYMEWYDVDAMGRYTSRAAGAATAADASLSQNSPVTVIKYHSRLVTKTTRNSTGGLTWAVTAQQWSGRSHAYVGRPKVTVGLFHQASGSTTWKYVKSVTTTSTGKATVTMGAPKTGLYRLVVAQTPTVWASYSTPVKGRI
jgi:hypothetical protein